MTHHVTTLKSLRLLALSGAALFGTLTQSRAQIVNGGFEQWTPILTMEDPTGWNSTNLLALFSGDSASVTKTRDAHFGQYAAKLSPRYSSLADDTIPAILIGQFTIGSRPAGIRFMYKYNPGSGDSVTLTAALYKGNTDSMENLVGQLSWTLGSARNSYTMAQADFEYLDNRTPDTLVVTIVAGSDLGARTSTVFQIDDIGTSTFPAATTEWNPLSIRISPNPGSGLFTLDGLPAANTTARVYDLNGRLVRSAAVNNNRIDLSGAQPGCYIIRVEGAAGIYSGRLILTN